MRAALIVAFCLFSSTALPHSFYSFSCCSGKDCKPIPVGDVKPTQSGWQVMITGEVIPYGESRIKDSPDGMFHRCASAADFSAKGRTLCLYVPPSGT